ncbi:MAG TPA: OpgC domain-containing protein, partial [Candidatus Binatia bacterium]
AILLSVLAHLVLNEFFGGIMMQIAVSAVGIAIMISVAALMEWFAAAQQASGRPALRAPVMGGGTQR